jgi:hypothetical protein
MWGLKTQNAKRKTLGTLLTYGLPYAALRHCHSTVIVTPLKKGSPTIALTPPHFMDNFLRTFLRSSHHSILKPIRYCTITTRNFYPTMAPIDPLSESAVPVLTGIEAAKQRAAFKAVDDHFSPSYRYIGVGSGSTVVYVVQAIAAKGRAITDRQIFVPTYGSSQSVLRQEKS